MAGDPANPEDTPALQDILDALDDPDCRAILSETAEPMTANELADACTIPQSTLYRKLELLSRASLVRELVEIVPRRDVVALVEHVVKGRAEPTLEVGSWLEERHSPTHAWRLLGGEINAILAIVGI